MRVSEKIHSLEQSIDTTPISIAVSLKEILLSNAKKCKLKKRNTPFRVKTKQSHGLTVNAKMRKRLYET